MRRTGARRRNGEHDQEEEVEEDQEERENVSPENIMAEKDDFTSLVSNITKLKGPSNYRTWAKDMEMCLLRNRCWEIVTSALPEGEARTNEWKRKDNWARGEIHLCCEADVQDIIIDSEDAYESWSLLKAEYSKGGELKVMRPKKEFSAITMTETSCAEYMKRVRKLVSELREYGEKIKEEDVVYTILLGLGEKYSPLVVTLTNMSSPEKPLSLARVSEQILTEELRLNQFGIQQKQDPNINNPLAHKADTAYKGEVQQSALVARTNPVSYRQTPYNLRSTYRGRGGYPYGGHTRFGTSQATSATVQQTQKPKDPTDPDTTHTWTQQQCMWSSQGDVYRNLPWGSAPWQPRINTMGSPQAQTLLDLQQREEKQCYTCGLWGHTRRNCWQEHPELHPANRQ